jgi:hypothetical protein
VFSENWGSDMCAVWKYQARRLKQIIDSNNETQAHIYMEQLMLFPVDIQDKIIEDISHLSHCNSDAVANILGHYSIQVLK